MLRVTLINLINANLPPLITVHIILQQTMINAESTIVSHHLSVPQNRNRFAYQFA